MEQRKQILFRPGYLISEGDLYNDYWRFAVYTWQNGEYGLDTRLWWD